jgi:hypothetical protein
LLSAPHREQKRGSRFYLASWECETPIGFSPCGTAFGALRKAYSARCNFFADDSSLTNRISWYLVPDDTPVYDQATVFFPRVDDHDGTGPSPFEETGPGRLVRTFDDGADVWGYPKDHVDGDFQDFHGDSPKKKYWVDGNPPTRPCAPAVCNCTFLASSVTSITAHLVIPGFPGIPEQDVVMVRVVVSGVTTWQGLVDTGGQSGTALLTASCTSGDNPDCAFGVKFGWVGSPFGELDVEFTDDNTFTCSPLTFFGNGDLILVGTGDVGIVCSVTIPPA